MKKIMAIGVSAFLLMPMFALAAAPTVAPSGDSTVDQLKNKVDSIATILIGITGVVAVIMIVVAAFMYITSGGDEGKTGNAKKMLTAGIVGLIIAVFAYTIVNVVLNLIS